MYDNKNNQYQNKNKNLANNSNNILELNNLINRNNLLDNNYRISYLNQFNDKFTNLNNYNSSLNLLNYREGYYNNNFNYGLNNQIRYYNPFTNCFIVNNTIPLNEISCNINQQSCLNNLNNSCLLSNQYSNLPLSSYSDFIPCIHSYNMHSNINHINEFSNKIIDSINNNSNCYYTQRRYFPDLLNNELENLKTLVNDKEELINIIKSPNTNFIHKNKLSDTLKVIDLKINNQLDIINKSLNNNIPDKVLTNNTIETIIDKYSLNNEITDNTTNDTIKTSNNYYNNNNNNNKNTKIDNIIENLNDDEIEALFSKTQSKVEPTLTSKVNNNINNRYNYNKELSEPDNNSFKNNNSIVENNNKLTNYNNKRKNVNNNINKEILSKNNKINDCIPEVQNEYVDNEFNKLFQSNKKYSKKIGLSSNNENDFNKLFTSVSNLDNNNKEINKNAVLSTSVIQTFSEEDFDRLVNTQKKQDIPLNNLDDVSNKLNNNNINNNINDSKLGFNGFKRGNRKEEIAFSSKKEQEYLNLLLNFEEDLNIDSKKQSKSKINKNNLNSKNTKIIDNSILTKEEVNSLNNKNNNVIEMNTINLFNPSVKYYKYISLSTINILCFCSSIELVNSNPVLSNSLILNSKCIICNNTRQIDLTLNKSSIINYIIIYFSMFKDFKFDREALSTNENNSSDDFNLIKIYNSVFWNLYIKSIVYKNNFYVSSYVIFSIIKQRYESKFIYNKITTLQKFIGRESINNKTVLLITNKENDFTNYKKELKFIEIELTDGYDFIYSKIYGKNSLMFNLFDTAIDSLFTINKENYNKKYIDKYDTGQKLEIINLNFKEENNKVYIDLNYNMIKKANPLHYLGETKVPFLLKSLKSIKTKGGNVNLIDVIITDISNYSVIIKDNDEKVTLSSYDYEKIINDDSYIQEESGNDNISKNSNNKENLTKQSLYEKVKTKVFWKKIYNKSNKTNKDNTVIYFSVKINAIDVFEYYIWLYKYHYKEVKLYIKNILSEFNGNNKISKIKNNILVLKNIFSVIKRNFKLLSKDKITKAKKTSDNNVENKSSDNNNNNNYNNFNTNKAVFPHIEINNTTNFDSELFRKANLKTYQLNYSTNNLQSILNISKYERYRINNVSCESFKFAPNTSYNKIINQLKQSKVNPIKEKFIIKVTNKSKLILVKTKVILMNILKEYIESIKITICKQINPYNELNLDEYIKLENSIGNTYKINGKIIYIKGRKFKCNSNSSNNSLFLIVYNYNYLNNLSKNYKSDKSLSFFYKILSKFCIVKIHNMSDFNEINKRINFNNDNNNKSSLHTKFNKESNKKQILLENDYSALMDIEIELKNAFLTNCNLLSTVCKDKESYKYNFSHFNNYLNNYKKDTNNINVSNSYNNTVISFFETDNNSSLEIINNKNQKINNNNSEENIGVVKKQDTERSILSYKNLSYLECLEDKVYLESIIKYIEK